MTIGRALKDAEEQLKAAGITSAHLDAQILMELVAHRDRSWLAAHNDEVLTELQTTNYRLLTSQRSQRIPLVHLTGRREFYGLELEITPAVLTPRVETEKMVEFAIQYAPKNSRLIDIGTGSGAVAIAIAKHRPDLDITATEVSTDALKIARRNATVHSVEIKFVASDLWGSIANKFAAVVTNLPYLKDDAELMAEVQKEPGVALFGGPDGLSLYRKFFTDLPKHLEPGGYVFIESDPWQQPELIKIAESAGLKVIEQDYFVLGFTWPLPASRRH